MPTLSLRSTRTLPNSVAPVDANLKPFRNVGRSTLVRSMIDLQQVLPTGKAKVKATAPQPWRPDQTKVSNGSTETGVGLDLRLTCCSQFLECRIQCPCGKFKSDVGAVLRPVIPLA